MGAAKTDVLREQNVTVPADGEQGKDQKVKEWNPQPRGHERRAFRKRLPGNWQFVLGAVGPAARRGEDSPGVRGRLVPPQLFITARHVDIIGDHVDASGTAGPLIPLFLRAPDRRAVICCHILSQEVTTDVSARYSIGDVRDNSAPLLSGLPPT
uniref:Uncharacterized protein n=1 Tax=Branchiostoma floridae TaxID=7739 RepID=C3Z1S0_BRAFL|eukprot:XP_002597425.1 hypothetical protein BRAFLDRAFT_80578 [Branchiostoma floridae]